MKGKKKPDNLEQFFQQVLKDYKEDPGVTFWERIIPQIPPKPSVTPLPKKTYNGWTLISAFMAGLLLSSIAFYWQSNSKLIDNLERELVENKLVIQKMEEEVIELKQSNQALTVYKEASSNDVTIKEKGIISASVNEAANLYNPTQKTKASRSFVKNSLIKLEIARNNGAVATTSNWDGSVLPPFENNRSKGYMGYLSKNNAFSPSYNMDDLMFDPNLIANNLLKERNVSLNAEDQKNAQKLDVNPFNLLTREQSLEIDFDFNPFLLSENEKNKLLAYKNLKYSTKIKEDELTSFITATLNPFSSYKYNLKGYVPKAPAISETAGISSSWNWSVYGGFETKTKWSVQMGIDFNKLTIVKESINNVRFNIEDAKPINGGYLYSFNQRSDGALRQVSISSTIFNQEKNDGQDIKDRDLFKIAFKTEQPIKIIRLPILGGYRFDLSKRFYVTPKIGVSAVWKTKEQTQLSAANTFSDRLSLQSSNIFLTSKTTTESLEANMRAEFGFRWRSKWYLIAEPRFKYSGNSLFSYKKLALEDAPFHLMVGIRFNVD